jgi:glucose/arabinose dehydrogenase
VQVIFSQSPRIASTQHFGCRIAQQGNTLFLTVGDRFSERDQAQQMNRHIGKVIRVNKDGTVPADTPFVATTSDNYGTSWRGNLFSGALAGQHIVRVELNGTAVVRQTRLLTAMNERIRDVQQGPDGLLYALTDAANGRLIRLSPANVN